MDVSQKYDKKRKNAKRKRAENKHYKGMGCSAINCTNSAGKGFKMFSFPQDPER